MQEEKAGRLLLHTADDADAGRTVRDLIRKKWGLVHHDYARAKYTPGCITVNGEEVYASRVLSPGDTLRVFIPDRQSDTTVPQKGPLEILYEDEDVIALNKPAGCVVHPSHGHYTDSLGNYVAFHFQEEGETHEIRTIGRLDKDTSGVILYGKNRTAVSKLSEEGGQMHGKIYLAVAEGDFSAPAGTVDAPIARLSEGSTLRTVRPDGDPAVTHWKVKKQYVGYALLEVTIETGRTHQIRVHMQHIGHPLLGDTLYGRADDRIGRTALHAWQVSFVQPFSGKEISLEAPLPPDLAALLQDGPVCKT